MKAVDFSSQKNEHMWFGQRFHEMKPWTYKALPHLTPAHLPLFTYLQQHRAFAHAAPVQNALHMFAWSAPAHPLGLIFP